MQKIFIFTVTVLCFIAYFSAQVSKPAPSKPKEQLVVQIISMGPKLISFADQVKASKIILRPKFENLYQRKLTDAEFDEILSQLEIKVILVPSEDFQGRSGKYSNDSSDIPQPKTKVVKKHRKPYKSLYAFTNTW